MDWRAALVTLFAAPFAGVVVLAIINRRTLFGDAADELSDISADEGWGVFQHNVERNTDA